MYSEVVEEVGERIHGELGLRIIPGSVQTDHQSITQKGISAGAYKSRNVFYPCSLGSTQPNALK